MRLRAMRMFLGFVLGWGVGKDEEANEAETALRSTSSP
jgi:hypothetical protein